MLPRHVLRKISTVQCKYKDVIKRFNSVTAQKLIYSDYGDPSEVVRLEKEELSEPKQGEVLVHMLAAPINPADINTIQGVYPIKPPLPSIPGNEGVGQVQQVGEGVKGLQVGDYIVPRENAWGTWRSHAVCPESQLIKITPGLDVVSAATMSVNPCTAYRMLKDFVELQKGDVVIQNGGNSACGQSVIQLCKAWGYKSVSIIRNRPDLDQLKNYLTELGAHHILTEDEVRTTTLFKEIPKPKLGLNCVGGKNALEMLRHLDKRAFMITYGGMSRDPVTIPTSALIFKDLTFKGYWMTRWNKENAGSSDHAVMLAEIASLYKKGELRAPSHELIPVSNFKDILSKALSSSGMTGKKFIFDFQSV